MRTYTNTTDSDLSSRNPRFYVEPGQQVEIDLSTASHTVRWWIRKGSLVLVEEPVAAAAKPKAKAPAKKKTAA